jgi:hypothetical protein
MLIERPTASKGKLVIPTRPMRLLLLLWCCLLPALTLAQTTVSGRVLDAKSGNGLPGVTILQTGTTNGVSSIYDGSFALTVPSQSDTVALVISFVGYQTQQVRVATGSRVTIRLEIDSKPLSIALLVRLGSNFL